MFDGGISSESAEWKYGRHDFKIAARLCARYFKLAEKAAKTSTSSFKVERGVSFPLGNDTNVWRYRWERIILRVTVSSRAGFSSTEKDNLGHPVPTADAHHAIPQFCYTPRPLSPYRLTVLRLHACLNLRVNPESGTLPHRAQQESLEVEEDLVFALAIPRRLMRDDGREIAVPAAVLHEHNAAGSVRLVWIRTDRHLQQLDISPSTVRTDASAQLQLRADRHRLIDRLWAIRHVPGSLTIKGHLVFESAWRLLHYARHPGAMRTETINPLSRCASSLQPVALVFGVGWVQCCRRARISVFTGIAMILWDKDS